MRLVLAGFFLLVAAASHANDCEWPVWEQFRSNYVSDGRVVDRSDSRLISTSEGQAYALFFALLANDRASFSQLLAWTETHLAGGDLTAQLPAWLWGQQPDSSWGVLDGNAASDADLWLAYTLIEAGRHWHSHHYSSLGYLLASRILREESAEIAGLGLSLLPAPHGFDAGGGRYRLNPSYVPLQLTSYLATTLPGSQWSELNAGSAALLDEASRSGWLADWVLAGSGQLAPDPKTGSRGSYDAIRNYLWAGMLPDTIPAKPVLLERMEKMASHVQAHGVPPRKIDTRKGATDERGSFGFSAAVVPLLSAQGKAQLAAEQAQIARDGIAQARTDRYYDTVLSLFSLGWYEKRYRFTSSGALELRQDSPCD